MMEETKMDANRLIAEVYERPALWNQRHLSYHNRDVTNRSWMEIADIFKLPRQVLKTKWKGLRDTFRAEIKKEQIYRKSKYTSNRSAWIHFKTLQFLKEQMLPRPPIWERAAAAATGADNSRDTNTITDAADASSAGGDIAAAAASSSEIHVPPADEDGASNIRITLVQSTSNDKESNRPTRRRPRRRTRIFSGAHYHRENLENLEDLAGGVSNEKVPRTIAGPASGSPNSIIPMHPDASLKETPIINDNSYSSESCTNQIEEASSSAAVIKLEPADHYDNNVAEFGNVVAAEEINNIDNSCGSMSKKITIAAEELMMATGSSFGDTSCVIGPPMNSQQQQQHAAADDPLLDQVNRFDDNYYFLMSLLPHIRTLPAERRMLLRIQMQQLVYQQVYSKTTSASSSSSSSSSLLPTFCLSPHSNDHQRP